MYLKYTMFFCLVSLFLLSCNRRIEKKNGKIEIELVVYNDPKTNIYDVSKIPVSKLFFANSGIIEVLPDYVENNFQLPYVFIKDGKFGRFKDLKKIDKIPKFTDLKFKNIGAKFVIDTIQNYSKRKMLTDTSFNGYNYKRIVISTKADYTVFYVHQTDTILPFSLSKQFDNEYKGILNRIDNYEKKSGRFTSLRMKVSDTIPVSFFNSLNNL